MWRSLLRRVDAVAAEGDEVAEECTRLLGVPADRVTMTPNGRDPDVFRPRPDGRGDLPVLAFVGALTEGKRPDRFVEAVAALAPVDSGSGPSSSATGPCGTGSPGRRPLPGSSCSGPATTSPSCSAGPT